MNFMIIPSPTEKWKKNWRSGWVIFRFSWNILFLIFLVNQLNVLDLLIGYWEFPSFLRNNMKVIFFFFEKNAGNVDYWLCKKIYKNCARCSLKYDLAPWGLLLLRLLQNSERFYLPGPCSLICIPKSWVNERLIHSLMHPAHRRS
jgi:hypothetical protein